MARSDFSDRLTNTPTGRACYWLRKWRRLQTDPTRTAARARLTKAGARWAYEVAVLNVGEAAALAAVKNAGLAVPEWLPPTGDIISTPVEKAVSGLPVKPTAVRAA